jgi:hypothetical protein
MKDAEEKRGDDAEEAADGSADGTKVVKRLKDDDEQGGENKKGQPFSPLVVMHNLL